MRKYLISILILFSFNVHAQFDISLELEDTVSFQPIAFASAMLMQKSDSVLSQARRSNEKGKILFSQMVAGDYILFISHPSFINYKQEVQIKSNLTLDKIILTPKNKILDEVFITAKNAIVLRGDTVEFLADSFKTRTGDMVENLLKLLPGMEIDDNGNISHQGKSVDKVLVNGEEFFGNDPTVATKNLQAQIVEKVEVFDSKTDLQSSTALKSDGETRTINLKLKKEYARGYFGKITAGGGLEYRWDNKAMMNHFEEKEQISIYGIMSSVGTTGLDWDESEKYGAQGGGMTITRNGNTILFRGDNDDDANMGIPKNWRSGFRYTNKYRDKFKLNFNYNFSKSFVESFTSKYSETTLPENKLNIQKNINNLQEYKKHYVHVLFNAEFDSLNTVTFNINGNVAMRNSTNNNLSENTNANAQFLSMNQIFDRNDNTSFSLNIRSSWTHGFKNSKRKFSINLNQNINDASSENFIANHSRYEATNTISFYQKKFAHNMNQNFSSSLTYIEPLGKNGKVRLEYVFRNTNTNNRKLTYTSDIDESILALLDTFSSNYKSINNSQRPSVYYEYENKKINFNFGSEVSQNKITQHDAYRNILGEIKNRNFFPSLWFRYKITKYKSFNCTYSGRTDVPNAQQLQSFTDYSDVFNISSGNPNLKVGYNQSIRLSLSNYSPLGKINYYASISGSQALNEIVTKQNIDEQGRSISTYINSPSSYSSYAYVDLDKKIVANKLSLSMNLGVNYYYNPNYINDALNYNKRLKTRFEPGIQYRDKDLLDFYISYNWDWLRNKNSIQPAQNTSFSEHRPSFYIQFYFPKFVNLSSNLNYYIISPTNPAQKFDRLLWRIEIIKFFLKDKSLNFSFGINDILNQNLGFERVNQANYFSETRFNTLARYWLVKLSWNFFSNSQAKKMNSQNGEENTSGSKWIKLFKK